jgi:hypothetical protein
MVDYAERADCDRTLVEQPNVAPRPSENPQFPFPYNWFNAKQLFRRTRGTPDLACGRLNRIVLFFIRLILAFFTN